MSGRWSARLSELRAELTVLYAAHRALAERVVSMERRALRAKASKPAAAAPEVRDVELGGRPGAPAPEASDLALARRLGQPASDAPAAFPAEVAGARAADATPPPPPEVAAPVEALPPDEAFEPMGLPNKDLVLACLEQLLGVDLGLTVDKRPVPRSRGDIERLYGSALVDDQGFEVGVILVSLPMAARMGGTLLGLPAPAIADQTRAGELEEEALLATSEVCNNLSGPVNRAGGCHVRSRELARVGEGVHAWLARGPKTLCLTDSEGDSLWIVAR